MKRITFIFVALYIVLGTLQAQEPRFIFDIDSTSIETVEVLETPLPKDTLSPKVKLPAKVENDSLRGDSMQYVLPKLSAWKMDARTGDRTATVFDTLYMGFNQESLVDGQNVAVGYLGNWGSPAISKIFFDRKEVSEFDFLNPFGYYYERPQDHTFINTKVPYSNLTYESGGGARNKEERFIGSMSLSFNENLTLGFDIDYVYARGFYNSLSTKQNSYDIFGSYITDKYQMKAYFRNNNYANLENGGLILQESIPSNFFDTQSSDLETRFSDTWNNLRGRIMYMTHKYSVGYDDSESGDFVPVASAFLTTNYADQKRSFTSRDVATLDRLYGYENTDKVLGGIGSGTGINASNNLNNALDDYMSYYSFKNTLGISLNEGFKPWVKFGLTAFIEQDMRKYLMSSYFNPALARAEYAQNATTIGGLLSKTKGEFLKYNLSAEVDVLGANIGESMLKADLSTSIKIKDKTAVLTAKAYVENLKPTFFERNFSSRYYKWTDDRAISESRKIQYNDFSDVRRVFVGGELHIPFTKTRLSGGVENIENYVYYSRSEDAGGNTQILQNGGNIQVMSLRLDQKLNAGILHFDNQLVYQQSSNKEVLPLPTLSLYSNLYILFKVAKVLSVQLGVDAHYNTKYYAPGYDPALLKFYNQKTREIGNYPMATAYANFHLKKTRFYVMMYNVGKGMVDTPPLNIEGYAYNPMVFKFGLSWNFSN